MTPLQTGQIQNVRQCDQNNKDRLNV